MAFNGADFSSGTCARGVTAVSDKKISAINQAGNEFIKGFRRAELFQPYGCCLISPILANYSCV